MKLESHENSFRNGVDQEQKLTNQLLCHLKFKAIRADLVLRCAKHLRYIIFGIVLLQEV
jgi:hypothetical protein